MEVGLWSALAVMVLTALGVKLVMKLGEGNTKHHWLPGPPKFPIVGNLPQLSTKGELLHSALGRLARAHGKVIRVWMGAWRPVIVVSGPQVAWEVLVSRATDYAARGITYNKWGAPGKPIIFAAPSGDYWLSLRRGLQGGSLSPPHVSTQSQLHDGDMASMVRDMQDEADANGVVRPLPHIQRMVVRLLCRLCFWPSFDDDKFAQQMAKVVEERIALTNHGTISDIFPFLRHLQVLDKSSHEMIRVKRKAVELLRPVLSSEALPPNSYAHFLLSQNISLEAAVFLVSEVFILGMDSTSNTTAWALLYLSMNPNIQDKLYEEIREWCNKNGCKTVRAEDVGKLQYLQAVVKETLRMKPIAPVIPRMATSDTTLAGKKVPKGTEILVNVHAVHYDPELWPEPHRFMPERFLPSPGPKGVEGDGERVDGPAKVMDKAFLPFGGGMRSCAGMELGKLQMAFTLANLVNAFEWSLAADEFEGKPPTEEHLYFVLMMKNPLVARITPRSQLV